jgi:hypothetical protein
MENQIVDFKKVEQDRQEELLNLAQQILSKVTNLTNKVANMTTELKEAHIYHDISSQYIDDDLEIHEEVETEFDKDEINQKLLNSEGVSLEAWLFSIGITLTKSTKHRFASQVASTFKALRIANPCKGNCDIEGKTKRNVYLYTSDDVPILKMCLKKILS